MFDVTDTLRALADAGLLIQVTTALILWVLFHIIQRQGQAPRYFRLWTRAWGFLALGFFALAFRYRLVTGNLVDPLLISEHAPLVIFLYGTYQISKLVGVALLTAGTLSAAGIRYPMSPWVWFTLGMLGLMTTILAPIFETTRAFQSVLIIPLYGIGAWALLRGRTKETSLGHTLTGGMLGALAVIWAIYGYNYFTATWNPAVGRVFLVFQQLMSLSTLVDSVSAILLGFGMVLILMEDLQAETNEFRTVLSARMAQTQKMEAVGRLVSGVAHELNNPLAAILAFSEELLSEPRTEPEREALEVIRDQSRRARTIVRDLLAFVGRREERWEQVTIGPLCERVARGVAPEFLRQGAVLDVVVAADVPVVVGDRAGLEQVVTNLLSNAAYAAGKSGRVQLSAVRSPEGELRIIVTDTGSGVPAEIQPRVFEPFFSTKPSGQGSGLGLSVTLGIVEQHHGRIEVENIPASGARFTVTLPLGRLSLAKKAPPTSTEPARVSGARPSTVLLIDDEQSVRMALRRWFERNGWTVDEAVDGAQALALLLSAPSEETYGIIVCDLRMPGMSGIELHARLAEQRPRILDRFVFATGDTASPETAAFLARVDRPVLEKPFELAQLAAVVEAAAGVR